MTSAAEVIERHGDDVSGSALELVRRFEGTDELAAAARLWCDRFGGGAHSIRSEYSRHDPARAAHMLLELALSEHVTLGEWVRRARRERPLGVQTEFETAMLSALLALWPARDALDRHPALLQKWSASVGFATAGSIALLLFDYTELGPILLGPPHYVPPDPESCGGCAGHPRDSATTCGKHVSWVARRRQAELAVDPFEDEIFAAIPRSAFASDKVLRFWMVTWLRASVPAPPWLWAAAEEALVTPHWLGGVSLLLRGDLAHHDKALEILERGVRQNDHPGAILDWFQLEGGGGMNMTGVFAGDGWGRPVRPRKLRALARAYLERGAWPGAWSMCLRPPRGKNGRSVPDADDAALDSEREVLAEALLSYVLDEQDDVGRRTRAVHALERLSPGGNGSWTKALSKVKAPAELAELAREAQRRMSHDGRGRLPDAELAIADALRLFLGREPIR